MALVSISRTSRALILLLALLPVAIGHVVGGGVNTDFSLTARSLLPSRTDMYAAGSYTADSYAADAETPPQNDQAETTQEELQKKFQQLLHNLSAGFKKTLLLKKKNSPRYLQKNCHLPAFVHKSLKELNPHVNIPATFIMFSSDNKEETASINLTTCSQKINELEQLNYICQSVASVRDLGEDFYPRYLRDVSCTSDSPIGCQNLSRDAYVFRRKSCKGHRWVVTVVRKTVNTGCTCMADQ